jgi:hypothetical protein
MTDTEISLDFSFKDGGTFGRNDEKPEIIQFNFWGASSLKTIKGNKSVFKEPFMKEIKIQTQLDFNAASVKATVAVASSISEGGKSVLWITAALRVVIKGIMSELMGMF